MLSQGIFDRQDLWLDVCRRSKKFGPNGGPAIDLTHETVLEAGRFYNSADNRLWMAVDARLAATVCGEGPLGLVELKPASPDDLFGSKSDVKVYTYRLQGDTADRTAVQCADRITKVPDCFYRFDHIPGYDVDDARLWDAFFYLFAIAESASTHKASSGAAADLEQTVRCVNGQPANPLRFIVATGDQWSQYIFDAFGLYDRMNLPRFKTLDNGRQIAAGYHDRLIAMQSHFKPEADRGCENSRKALEILQLIFLLKELRNDEGHSEKLLLDSDSMVRNFLFDHIMLIYALLQLGFTPDIPFHTLIGSKKRFYAPVQLERYVEITSPSADIVKEGSTRFVKPFEPCTATATTRRGAETVSLDFTISQLDVKVWSIRLEGKHLTLINRPLLEKINRIDYNPMIEKIIGELNRQGVDALEKHDRLHKLIVDSVDSLTLKEQTDAAELREAISSVRKMIDTTLPGEVRRQRRMIVALYAAIVVGVLAIAGVLMCANISSWAIGNRWCYALSQSVIGFNPHRNDFPYLRACKLDSQLHDEAESIAGKSDFSDIITSRDYQLRRREIARCYSRAVELYTDAVDRAPNENGEAAYRLALLHATGRGTEFNRDKAVYYADLARKNRADARGLYATMLLLRNNNGDHTRAADEIALLENDSADSYLQCARELLIAADSYPTATDSTRARVLESMQRLMKIESPREVAEITKFTYCVARLTSITADDGSIVFDKDPYDAFIGLWTLSLVDNMPAAQLQLGFFLDNFGSPTNSAELYATAFYNGQRVQNLISLSESADSAELESFKNRWPEVFDCDPIVDYAVTLNEAKLAKQRQRYDLAGRKFNEVKAMLLSDMHIYDLHFSEVMRLLTPDSASVMFDAAKRSPVSRSLTFTGNPDSLTRRKAVDNYLEALYAYCGFGNRQADTALADSLLDEAHSAGMVDATITRAKIIYDRTPCHDDWEEALGLMEQAAHHSDKARVWMAARTRGLDPAASEMYVDQIADSMNLYKIMRLIDRNMLSQHAIRNRDLNVDNQTYLLLRRLANATDYELPVADRNQMSAIMSYLALKAALNPYASAREVEFFAIASNNLNTSGGYAFMPLELMSKINPAFAPTASLGYNGCADCYNTVNYAEKNPWQVLRVDLLRCSGLNESSITPEYPVNLIKHLEPADNLFLLPSQLYDL